MDLQYIVYGITGIIAIIGIIVKTKRDGQNDAKSKHFNNLTSGGKLLLVLSASLVGINIFLQYSKDQETKNEKALLPSNVSCRASEWARDFA